VTADADRKRNRVRVLQRYVLNPPMKMLAWAGLFPGHVLLETRGRRSGKPRRNVVGLHVVGGVGWIVAEQGHHAGYVRNLEHEPDVRVRIGRRWQGAQARVIDDDDPQARLDSFGRRSYAAAVRRFGTDLTTVRLEFALPDEP
jgi:deazaflavin-dependent oxidoreductase (nitroreductase family)